MDDLQDKIASALRKADLQVADGSKMVLTRLHGDASARQYLRVETGGSHGSLVAMILVPEQEPYLPGGVQVPRPDELPFFNIQRYLKRIGIRVPEIRLVDEHLGVVLLEDLGEHTLERRLVRADVVQRQELYQQAVDLLVQLQAATAHSPDPGCLAFSRVFGFDLLRWELDHFLEYLVGADRNCHFSRVEKKVVEQSFDTLARTIASWPRCFVHRDFQSRNLMLKDGAMALIDFQDALLGPAAYDLVALLRDSYVVLDFEQIEKLIDRYLEGCRVAGMERPDARAFRSQFHRLTLQRKMKDAGRFVFIHRVKGNPDFLPFVPTSLRYVAEAFDRLDDLGSCRQVLARSVPQLAEQSFSWEVS